VFKSERLFNSLGYRSVGTMFPFKKLINLFRSCFYDFSEFSLFHAPLFQNFLEEFGIFQTAHGGISEVLDKKNRVVKLPDGEW